MNTKDLLIIEKSSSELKFTGEAGNYVLEGVFGELDKKNRNNRIYTAEEYLPQIEALQAKIAATKLLGELDHPQNFDVSLKNVSHIIEEITYDEQNKQIKGRIRLLDTDAGRQAKALVDAGVPLQISSRAAGAVESNGKVKIKQLFTYDLVADPGFENAELKRVNESYGFSNDDDIQIFEINKQEQPQIITENKPEEKMAESKFITVEDFNKYSKYLAEEIKSLKEGLSAATTKEDESATAKLENYVNYLSEKLDQAIQYSEHIAEKTDQSIQYSESLAEKLDQSIQYTEHVAEGVETIKNYTNYLAESYNEGATTHENLLKYIDYLKENLEKVTEYAEYVAETVNSNLLLEGEGEESGKPAEELEDETKDVTAPTVDAEGKEYEHGEEKEDNSAELEKELEGEGDAAGEEISEEAEVEITPKGDVEVEIKPEEDEEESEDEEEEDAMEAYKNSITEKLQALINKAEEKKVAEPHFFRFVSESTRNKFNELETADKSKVLNAVEGKGFLTEGQILGLWNTALITDAPSASEPNVVKMMPSEYKDTWNGLSEAKKNQILAQSKYHRLETEYQVRNFWQTRDLREVAQVMEKVEMVKESKEEVKTLPYDLTGVQEQLAKRFKK